MRSPSLLAWSVQNQNAVPRIKDFLVISKMKWWARLGLNQRPLRCQRSGEKIDQGALGLIVLASILLFPHFTPPRA